MYRPVSSVLLALAIAIPSVGLSTRSALAQECIINSPMEQPVSDRRAIEIRDWQVSFAVPENYRTFRQDNRVEILTPDGYEMMQCLISRRPPHGVRPYSITISLQEDFLVTEQVLRERLNENDPRAGGKFLGATELAGKSGFMYIDYGMSPTVNVSIPLPERASTITLSADIKRENDEVVQKAVFGMLLETFSFEPGDRSF